MAGIDMTLTFIPLNIAVLTVSDTRALAQDRSGDTLVDRLTQAGHKLAARALVQDDVTAIQAQVKAWVASTDIDIINLLPWRW